MEECVHAFVHVCGVGGREGVEGTVHIYMY